MTLLRYFQYVLACQLYTLRLAWFAVHSALVFLSKPGARILVPVALFGLVYLMRSPLDRAVGSDVDTLWASLVQPIFGTDLANLTRPLNIELTAVALLFLLGLVMLLLASMLQPIVGALWAPRLPLPPLPPMVVPDTEVKAVTVTRQLASRTYPSLPQGLASLSAGLPEDLQALLQPTEGAATSGSPAGRFTRPPAAPQGTGNGAGQGMEPDGWRSPPVRPEAPPKLQRPQQPPPPPLPPRAKP